MPTDAQTENDIEVAKRLASVTKQLKKEVGKRIVGQEAVIDQLLISLFSNTHCFMVGVPGLAKTLMVSTLSEVLQLHFKRIQFTPDLMPSDITGTDVIQEDAKTGKRDFMFLRGPIFTNMLLADEINRTPPKTQAALLEAMQERQVTVGSDTMRLEPPFFVLATQNPLEQEGTYPLPEAQLDRFMFNIFVDYPDIEEERAIYEQVATPHDMSVKPLLSREEILELQEIVKRVPVGEHVVDYTLQLVRKTRPQDESSPKYVHDWLDTGAGPRAGLALIQGAKARALMHGRYHATCDDVAFLTLPVMRHRIVTNFNASADGIKPDDVIKRILDETPKTDVTD